MTYYWIFKKKTITRDVTSGTGIPTLPERPSSLLVIRGVRVAQCFAFCVLLCEPLLVFLSFFFLAVIFSVIRFSESHCPLYCLHAFDTTNEQIVLPAFNWKDTRVRDSQVGLYITYILHYIPRITTCILLP